MAIKNQVVSCRLTGALLDNFNSFREMHSFDTASDALRALIVRGLFIEEKPKGKWSESAWRAAYQNYLMKMHAASERALLTSGQGVIALVSRALDETAARLGFDTVE